MGRQIRDEVAGSAIDPDRLSVSAPQARPRYQQIVAALRKEIEDNTLKAGDMLPSEAELRERFSVSRHTIREALRALRDEGFVESRQGAATRVTKPENAIYTYSVSDVAELLQYATDVRYEIDKTSVVVADEALASRLSCSVGSRWLRVEGFRYVKGDWTPLCWTEIYILSEYSGVAVQIARHADDVGPDRLLMFVEIGLGHGERFRDCGAHALAEPRLDAEAPWIRPGQANFGPMSGHSNGFRYGASIPSQLVLPQS